MYISLYRRYRPQTFSDVVGQTAAIGVITRAIESGAIGHAYLFSGPRGCGKTTIARLFAKAVNCTNRHGPEPCNECETCRSILDGSCLDVIEIDGASNNSVDEIRDLKEHVALASFSCPYKIYIIDEVHMLSISAFNALLKTLEEPPERVVFILATTAPHKVPVTIRSRCQHIPFHGMTPEQIVSRLQQIAEREGMEVQDEALWEIARNSDGGMRDALSLAEQAIAFGTGKISRETVDKLLGGGSSASIRNWITVCSTSPESALPELEAIFRSGAVPERFLSTLFVCIRNLWLQARWGNGVITRLSLSEEEKRWLNQQRSFLSAARLESLMAQISSLLPQVRRGLSNDVMTGLLVNWMLSSGESVTPASPGPAQANVQYTTTSGRAENTAFGGVRPQSQSQPQPQPQPRAQTTVSAIPSPAAQSTESKSARTVEEQTQLPITPESSSSVSEVNFDVSAMQESSQDVLKRIYASFDQHPQIAAALSLADIVYDGDAKNIYITLDTKDAYAFRLLDSPKASLAALSIMGEPASGAYSIELRAGKLRSTYRTPQAPSLPKPDEAQKRETSDSGKGAAGAGRSTPAALEQNGETQPAPKKTSYSGGLSELLSSFPESDVLYCRPNENQEEEENEEEE